MANTIAVLVEKDNMDYYIAKLNEIEREIVLKAIGEDIASEYLQYGKDIYNVVPNLSNISNTSDIYILGFERPDEIIKMAEEWNDELRDNAVEQLEELEALAKEKGFSTVSQYIKENWKSEDFANIIYWLKYALMDLDNAPNYNTTALIYDEANGWNVIIEDSTLSKIKEHPENFVYLVLSYQEN